MHLIPLLDFVGRSILYILRMLQVDATFTLDALGHFLSEAKPFKVCTMQEAYIDKINF